MNEVTDVTLDAIPTPYWCMVTFTRYSSIVSISWQDFEHQRQLFLLGFYLNERHRILLIKLEKFEAKQDWLLHTMILVELYHRLL